MLIPADKRLCLAHESDRQPKKRISTPPAFCASYRTCVRHQAISQVPFDGSHTASLRVCQPGKTDAYISIEAPVTESEGGEA